MKNPYDIKKEKKCSLEKELGMDLSEDKIDILLGVHPIGMIDLIEKDPLLN